MALLDRAAKSNMKFLKLAPNILIKLLFINRNNINRVYLKCVRKEIMIEHWPILATNVYYDFAEFVTNEIRHCFVLCH